MKAVRIHEHGGPEVLRYEDAPEPQPRADEVVVRVKACSLNHLDLWVRPARRGSSSRCRIFWAATRPAKSSKSGAACDQVKVGDRVLVAPGKSSRRNPFTAAGRDNFSPDYGLFGHHYPGLQAEYVAIPEVNALPIPGDLDFERAASIPLVFLTAWHMLVGIARIQMCEDVLIIGGSSGVGIAAIQIAKLFHCRVIATAGGEEKMAKARELGADFVIDHYQQNIRDEVRRLTNSRGVDIVIEHVGKATWEHSAACLAHHGRLVTCGATTGANVPLSLAHLFVKHLSLNGSFMGTMGEL